MSKLVSFSKDANQIMKNNLLCQELKVVLVLPPATLAKIKCLLATSTTTKCVRVEGSRKTYL